MNGFAADLEIAPRAVVAAQPGPVDEITKRQVLFQQFPVLAPLFPLEGRIGHADFPAGAAQNVMRGNTGQGVEPFRQIGEAQMLVHLPDPVAGRFGHVAKPGLTFAQRHLHLAALVQFPLQLLGALRYLTLQQPGPQQRGDRDHAQWNQEPDGMAQHHRKSVGFLLHRPKPAVEQDSMVREGIEDGNSCGANDRNQRQPQIKLSRPTVPSGRGRDRWGRRGG